MQRLWTTPEPLKQLTNYVLKLKKNGAKFIKESKNSQKIFGAFGAKKKNEGKFKRGPRRKQGGPVFFEKKSLHLLERFSSHIRLLEQCLNVTK